MFYYFILLHVLTHKKTIIKEHECVGESQCSHTEPISLESCLAAFTKEEHLSEAEKYYCSACQDHQLASKKLQIWRLPPILVSCFTL